MAKKFSTLREKMTPAAQALSDAEHKRLIEEMSLSKLRGAMKLTQETMAATLEINQSEVSRIEKRADMLVSTLSNYVKALGGTLQVRASFPSGKVVNISQFSGLAEEVEHK
jgi:DNA-binding XRE family transcriptional regulator